MPRKITKTPCRCAAFYVLVNVHETESGDLTWDEELTTGCSGTLTGRDFAPGHDAKLKGYLIRWGIAGHEVTWVEGGMSQTANAVTVASRFGFAQQVRNGIANGLIKAEIRKIRRGEVSESAEAATRVVEEIHARDEQQNYDIHSDEVAEEPEIVKAKVGRWTYEGTVDGDEFTYTDKNGNPKTTTKFTLI